MKTCVVLALFLMAGVSLGDIQKRVNNGRPCTADETKSFVFLRISNTLFGDDSICSGTIIENGNWILTAKHCEDNTGLSRVARWFSPTEINDVTLTQTITSKKTFKHDTADVMLIKVNTGMAGMPLVSEADCNKVLKQISPTSTVPMVVPARDTQTRKDTETDVSMCADINVERSGIDHETKENCVYWNAGACHICGGDSGAGVIYNNAVFAVHTGYRNYTDQNRQFVRREELGIIVCNGEIRQWIDDTMTKNP